MDLMEMPGWISSGLTTEEWTIWRPQLMCDSRTDADGQGEKETLIHWTWFRAGQCAMDACHGGRQVRIIFPDARNGNPENLSNSLLLSLNQPSETGKIQTQISALKMITVDSPHWALSLKGWIWSQSYDTYMRRPCISLSLCVCNI